MIGSLLYNICTEHYSVFLKVYKEFFFTKTKTLYNIFSEDFGLGKDFH